jgi:acetyl-CoA carboxylase biotin carboxyl carrier protein
VNLELLRELIRILEDSNLAELEVEDDKGRIRISKMSKAGAAVALAAQDLGVVAAPASAPVPAAEAAAASAPEVDAGLDYITSPMPGTFYSAASPGEAAFVQPGDLVKPNQTVCIVEAMKIMNEVAAKDAGIIEKVLVENGEPVEFGQPLFAIRRSA